MILRAKEKSLVEFLVAHTKLVIKNRGKLKNVFLFKFWL